MASKGMTTAIRTVLVDLGRNSIVLEASRSSEEDETRTRPESGILDMGMRGRLIGIEVGDEYFSVSGESSRDSNLVRSEELEVQVSRLETGAVRSIEIPRSADSYEITFPIGSQCWRQHVNGEDVDSCVTTIGRSGSP